MNRDAAVGYLICKGYDLEDAEETAKTYNLSDMDFDEVSFVRRGANQKAHVVLWKSDQDNNRAEVIRKHAGNLVLAERAEARLSELRKAEPMATYEQAVAVVLNEDPSLYQP
jgi:hypothetical protein